MDEQKQAPKNAVHADMAISAEEVAEASREQQAAKAAMEADAKPRITVNGVGITHTEINREIQYHPSSDLFSAKQEAMRALVIRELLLQEAINKGICSGRPSAKDEEAIIDNMLDQEISVPEVDEESCRRYFENNRLKFRTSPLYEVSHILIAAPPNKKAKRKQARLKAERLIKELEKNPSLFETLAREHSACSSKDEGGRMGQVSKGQTTAAFETALFKMGKGETSTEPVETHFGYHILRVHNKVDGKDLAFDSVKDWIADFLKQSSWNRAFSQYVQILAGKAEITGFQLRSVDSPLVQ